MLNARSSAASLPVPPPELQAHSAALQKEIHQAIQKAGGSLPFSDYMAMALYHPERGYYRNGLAKFGRDGDFITAPDISPLFARCLARQCQPILAALGSDSRIIEFGAGNGRLAVDLLKALDQQGQLPIEYCIIEVSPVLQQRQRAQIEKEVPQWIERIRWLDELPESPVRAVVIANELLDAFPVEGFRCTTDAIERLCVETTADHLLQLVYRPTTFSPLLEAVEPLHKKFKELGLSEYASEINLQLSPWLQAVRASLSEGALLLCDYGFPRHEYYHPQRTAGTLMCHYRHRAHADPLWCPGGQDITAHVDFTALADAALSAGLSVSGYTTQALFLLACGLTEHALPEDAKAQYQQQQAIKQLTHPEEMGELFKVMLLATPGLAIEPIGFSLRDLRHALDGL